MIQWSETALIFPGQGSQQVGMGKEIAEAYPVAAEVFAQADEVLGVPFSKLCWEGPEAELNDTYNTQPALFVTSLAIVKALEYELQQRDLPPMQPAFVAGHSLGELTALAVSGALDFEHGLKLVRERARLMHAAGEHSPGSMAAIIGMEKDTLNTICAEATTQTGQPVVVANDNCPGQIVISGAIEAVAVAMEQAEAQGAKMVVKIAISVAAHSPLMAPSAEAFSEAVNITPISPPRFPVLGNANAGLLPDVETIREELNAQLLAPVRWTEIIEHMVNGGVNTFMELGSKDVLSGLVKRIHRKSQRITIENPAQLQKLFED